MIFPEEKVLLLIGRKLIEELKEKGENCSLLAEKSWRIEDASSYSLYYRELKKDEKKDNPEQTHVFKIDWEFTTSEKGKCRSSW